MVTSWSSRSSHWSSYSMLTSQLPDPVSLGQQLIMRGRASSSWFWRRHLRTPTSMLTGKPLSGFFMAMRLDACHCFFVDVWVGLQARAAGVIVGHLDPNLAGVLIVHMQMHKTVDVKLLYSSVAVNHSHQFLL